MTEQPTITPNPDGDGVILHLPDITSLDTQAWSVDIGLTPEALEALRDALNEGPPVEGSCPGIETVPNRCTCTCQGCKHHCGAHHTDGSSR